MNRFPRMTRQGLRDRFKLYNSLYFGDELKEPEHFELWTNNVKCVGWIRAIWNSKKNNYITYFHINNRCYRWSEDCLRRVMLHEMIHMAIGDYLRPLTFWQRIFPSKQHDREFVEYMNRLNEKYNLDITVRAKFMREFRK